MKFTGDIISAGAARRGVRDGARRALLRSCVEGVQDLKEIDPDALRGGARDQGRLPEIQVQRDRRGHAGRSPREIEAKIEGTPLGVVGRLTARSLTRLAEEDAGNQGHLFGRCHAGRQARQHRPAGAALQGQGHGKEFAERLRAAFAPGPQPEDAHDPVRTRRTDLAARRPSSCSIPTIRRCGRSPAAPR